MKILVKTNGSSFFTKNFNGSVNEIGASQIIADKNGVEKIPAPKNNFEIALEKGDFLIRTERSGLEAKISIHSLSDFKTEREYLNKETVVKAYALTSCMVLPYHAANGKTFDRPEAVSENLFECVEKSIHEAFIPKGGPSDLKVFEETIENAFSKKSVLDLRCIDCAELINGKCNLGHKLTEYSCSDYSLVTVMPEMYEEKIRCNTIDIRDSLSAK